MGRRHSCSKDWKVDGASLTISHVETFFCQTKSMGKTFKDGFVWGVATASYQIEGATKVDGRGDSVWDLFCRFDGKVFEGQSGDKACDHYRRYKDDIALMKALGVNGYRFSLSWSRILPEGTGRINEKGLEFYDKLVDELLAKGIEPFATLFHWDYPTELYYKGGWLNRDSVQWFADYTAVVMDRLSDRVTNWMTLNEPQCFIALGHQTGVHAPGVVLSLEQCLRAAHHALLAHGVAVQTIRAQSKKPCRVGFAPVGSVTMPIDDDPKNVEAARRAMFELTGPDLWKNSWWMDPVFLGQYPESGLKHHEPYMPEIGADDMKTICQPLDFFGVNTYQGVYVKANAEGNPEVVNHPIGHDHTAYNWPVTPDCLYWGPKYFYERYKKPILVTENGMACVDWVALDGKVHDPQRIDYLNRHLLELRKAHEEGVDVMGYLQWCFTDNFEWAEGYRQRFGIVYHDNDTHERIPKDSYHWYKGIIASNGGSL